jgi:hypothetical protein
MKMSQFDRHILNYCKLHPDDALSSYFVKCYKESSARKKAKWKKWSLIGKALEHYESRGDIEKEIAKTLGHYEDMGLDIVKAQGSEGDHISRSK